MKLTFSPWYIVVVLILVVLAGFTLSPLLEDLGSSEVGETWLLGGTVIVILLSLLNGSISLIRGLRVSGRATGAGVFISLAAQSVFHLFVVVTGVVVWDWLFYSTPLSNYQVNALLLGFAVCIALVVAFNSYRLGASFKNDTDDILWSSRIEKVVIKKWPDLGNGDVAVEKDIERHLRIHSAAVSRKANALLVTIGAFLSLALVFIILAGYFTGLDFYLDTSIKEKLEAKDDLNQIVRQEIGRQTEAEKVLREMMDRFEKTKANKTQLAEANARLRKTMDELDQERKDAESKLMDLRNRSEAELLNSERSSLLAPEIEKVKQSKAVEPSLPETMLGDSGSYAPILVDGMEAESVVQDTEGMQGNEIDGTTGRQLNSKKNENLRSEISDQTAILNEIGKEIRDNTREYQDLQVKVRIWNDRIAFEEVQIEDQKEKIRVFQARIKLARDRLLCLEQIGGECEKILTERKYNQLTDKGPGVGDGEDLKWINVSTIRFGVTGVILFFVQVLVGLYRYNLRLAAFYESRANAIRMLDKKFTIESYKNLSEVFEPGFSAQFRDPPGYGAKAMERFRPTERKPVGT